MLPTFILIVISIPSPPHSFIPGLNLPFLQILTIIAFLFFGADSTDSVDCLPTLVRISVFLLFSFSVFLHFLVVGSVR